MSLVIEPGLYRNSVKRDLGRLVPPTVWSMDEFGFVSVNAPPMASQAVLLLAEVAAAPGLLRIAGSEAAAASVSKGSAIHLRDVGGQTFFDPAAQGEDADVVVFYDTTNNYGNGYWVRGTDGSQIDFPPHILLGHELAHAAQVFKGGYTDEQSAEAFAVAAENALRAADTPALPARLGHDGGTKSPPKKTTTKTSSGGSRGCFVATASYGSDRHPPLRDLRELRDDLLRHSRAGRELYDRLNDRYRALSVPVIAAMADPETRGLVRDWIVGPVMGYLELVRDLPDLPVEDAGPWTPFLEGLRDEVERFASAVPLPAGLASLDAADAVEELLVALRYQLRAPERRRAWLAELRRDGELPLGGGRHPQRAALGDRLRDGGRTEEEIGLILDPGCPRGGAPLASLRGFGADLGTSADSIRWRYTVTLRNATPDETYLNLRVYYLAEPGDPDSMGLVTLDDLKPGEVAVFPLCECTRLQSYYIEGDIVTAAGDTGQFVFPEDGSMTAGRAGDAFACEDSWAF